MIHKRGTVSAVRSALPVVLDLGAYRRATQSSLDPMTGPLDQRMFSAHRVAAELHHTTVEFRELVKLFQLRRGFEA